jgi:hypothetical protein
MTRAPVAALHPALVTPLALVALLIAGCSAPLTKLPPGPGLEAADASQALAAATAACRAVSTMTAEAEVRGSIGGRRTRARLALGVSSPASARIEAYAFGQRIFTLASTGTDATLLLDQDKRVLARAPADAVLEALTALPLGPAGLKAALTGCADTPAQVAGERRDSHWRVISQGTASQYLRRRDEGAPWELVAIVHRDRGFEWRIDYGRFVSGLPRDIRFTANDRKRFDLHLQLNEIELNVPLTPDVFEVKTPTGFEPITLEELRRGGPLGTGGSS